MINLSQQISINIIDEITKVIPYFDTDIQEQNTLKIIIENTLNNYEITSKRTDLVKGDLQEKASIFLINKKLENYSDNTLKNYGYFFNKMVDYFIKPVSMITTPDLRMFIATVYKDCSPSSKNSHIDKTKAFFQWLQDEGYINGNPSRNLKTIKTPKRKSKHIKAIDLEKMRDACKTTRDRALLEFLVSTGCRVGECSDALLTDIDWDNNSFRPIGKGDKERIVYFSTKCRYYLMKYIDERQKEGILIDSLFITARKPYRQLGTRAIQRDIKRIAADAEIAYNVFPHLCRHTFTQSCVDSGMSINVTQELMGHSSSDTTATYYEISDEMKKQEYRKIAQ